MIASIKSVFLMDSCLQQKLIKCKKRNYQKKKKIILYARIDMDIPLLRYPFQSYIT